MELRSFIKNSQTRKIGLKFGKLLQNQESWQPWTSKQIVLFVNQLTTQINADQNCNLFAINKSHY